MGNVCIRLSFSASPDSIFSSIACNSTLRRSEDATATLTPYFLGVAQEQLSLGRSMILTSRLYPTRNLDERERLFSQ